MTRALIALAVLVALVGVSQPAWAGPGRTVKGYGESASAIAEVGNCKNLRRESGQGVGFISKAVCDLRGRKVEILTFRTKITEARWVYRNCQAFPRETLMLGAGFVVLGSARAARTGERVYNGRAYQCDDIV